MYRSEQQRNHNSSSSDSEHIPLKPQSRDKKSERILITGGNGFIGSHLAKFLLLKGHFVRVVDLDSNNYMKEYCSEELRLDLRDWNGS